MKTHIKNALLHFLPNSHNSFLTHLKYYLCDNCIFSRSPTPIAPTPPTEEKLLSLLCFYRTFYKLTSQHGFLIFISAGISAYCLYILSSKHRAENIFPTGPHSLLQSQLSFPLSLGVNSVRMLFNMVKSADGAGKLNEI